MKRKSKLLIVIVIDLVIGALILQNVKSHAPVQSGTAPEFWMVACDIDVDGSMKDFGAFGGIYPPQDAWAIYYIQGYHDQFLYRVRLSEIAPHLPKIESELKNKAENDETPPWLVSISKAWTREGGDENEVQRLLALIRQAQLASIKEHDKEHDDEQFERKMNDERDFYERWQRAGRYWATVLFEFLWLSFVLVFAALPWMRNSGRLAWAIHLALTLPLLFVPFFLGYVPNIFTSAFPAGGVFYPYVIFWFRGLPILNVDIWLLEHAPQPFEPLTQAPGPMLAITEMGLVGPIVICAIGLAIFAGVYAFAATWDYLKAKSTDQTRHADN
jgi:hypothetical protein